MEIAVVGLGPAGLRTGMLLEEAGHTVTYFEARDRIGGRLHTLKTEKGFYEAGGEWIDSDHERLLKLVNDLCGKPVPSDQWPGVFIYGDQTYSEDDFGEAANGDWSRVEEAADAIAIDLDEDPVMNVIYAGLDDQNLHDFLDKCSVTKLGRATLENDLRSDEGEDTRNISFLGWLCGRVKTFAREGGEMSSDRFPTGASGFCEAMRLRLRGQIYFNHVLQQIEVGGSRVMLSFQGDSRSFDRVVLAIPAGNLKKINFVPGLSNGKLEAFEAVKMSRTIKVALHFSSRFWIQHGIKGRIKTDGLMQQCWDGSRGEEAILLCYLCGDQAMEIASHWPDSANELLDGIEKALPDARENFVKAELHDWVGDEFAGGGFFSLPPGFVMGHWNDLMQPEMGIHFAGDYNCTWSGFIEGALESAERVAAEIGR